RVAAATGTVLLGLLLLDRGDCFGWAEEPSEEQLHRLWSDLAGDDAVRAYRSACALIGAPASTLPFLQDHLKPAPIPDPARLARLLASLDSNEFHVRQHASAELEKLGDLASPALRTTLANKPSLEMRLRVEAILSMLDHRPLAGDE